MLKEIIRPQSQKYTIEIPKEYLNQNVMILVLPLSGDTRLDDKRMDIIQKTSGILSGRNIDPLRWQKEIRDEWEDRR